MARQIKYRAVRKISAQHLSQDIQQSILHENEAGSVDDLVSNYNTIISDLIDKHAPMKSANVPVRQAAEWYSDELRSAKQERRQCERRWRKSGLTVHKEAFISKRNEVNKMINEARSRYYRNLIQEHQDNPKRLFNVMFTLLGRKKSRVQPPGRSDRDLSQEFNMYFVNKITNVRQSMESNDSDAHGLTTIPTPSNSPFADHNDTILPPPSPILDSWQPVTEAEIRRLIKQSPTKHCSLDPLPTWLLKECLDSFVHPIAEIINSSLSSGVVPAALKTARITPLIKKQSLDPTVFANYRPVSNLPFVAKVLERVVHHQLTQYMAQNDLQERMQSAYRSNHSTETALVRVQHDIITAMSGRKACLLVLLDLSSAFDTVDHQILIEILRKNGIAGTPLKWFESYLHGRSQYVAVGDECSQPTKLLYGVPQGSVLGPVLFVLYTTSLGRLLSSFGVNYHFYADDTSVYMTFEPGHECDALEVLQRCLIAVHKHLKELKLKMNNEKTEVLLLSTKSIAKKLPHVTALTVGDTEVSIAAAVRYIGILFDRHLSMESHINNVCKTALMHLSNIARIRRALSRKSCEQLVHALITSKLDYANALYNGLPKVLMKKLQSVQNIAARILTYTPRASHITPVLRELHWLPVQQRVEYKICLMVYKCLNGVAPLYLRELISIRRPNRQLRTADATTLEVPLPTSNLNERAFGVAAPKLWNALPSSLRASTSLDVFKKGLKTYIFKRTFTE